MTVQVICIVEGRATRAERFDHQFALQPDGAVRIVFGSLGTEIRWKSDSPCVASLAAACELLDMWPSPFILRYNFIGWAEERLPTAEQAKSRLSSLMVNGDRLSQRRVYLKPLVVPSSTATPLLATVYRDGGGSTELSVDCGFDPLENRFVVQRIGARSVIGQVFGTSPLTYPCLFTGTYAQEVAKSYGEALDSKAIIYEHVLALLPLPGQELHWVPYHRLIVPDARGSGRPILNIYSEMAPVDIRLA